MHIIRSTENDNITKILFGITHLSCVSVRHFSYRPSGVGVLLRTDITTYMFMFHACISGWVRLTLYKAILQ